MKTYGRSINYNSRIKSTNTRLFLFYISSIFGFQQNRKVAELKRLTVTLVKNNSREKRGNFSDIDAKVIFLLKASNMHFSLNFFLENHPKQLVWV